jgi:thiamine biosynthesis protein ThiI
LSQSLPDVYLLRFGEMAIKGRNRDRYVDDLVRILKPRIAKLNGKIEKKHNKLLIRSEAPPEQVRAALAHVFGLVSISPIWRLPLDLDVAEAKAWELLQPHLGSEQSFAVVVKRANKGFSMKSGDIARQMATYLYKRGLDLPVDLKHPELPLGIIIEQNEIWLHIETLPGLGGMPVCEYARYGLLLSGGIDSPVAGNMIQKRGGQLEVVYFDTPPYTTDGAREKVLDLCELLAKYQNQLVLHTVNITRAMQTIRALVDPGYSIILSRRLMVRISERLLDCQALVTGESLSQVASQSIENLAVVDRAAQLPVLRPLIGLDKQEIIDRANSLGSFEISKRPDQDCCSLFAPKDPVTRAQLAEVEAEEAKLDLENLIETTLAAVQETRITST